MIGWTLARYLSVRFLQAIGAVFLMISGMIYVVDFVELLRRTSDIPGVSAGYIAYFSFLRVPSVSEQIMPFCVLFGTMATFLNLTRSLELLVARAAGVSVWGFLVPPLAIAAATGIGSVVLFNPISATMKHRADTIETQLFGRNGKQNNDTGLWIRQQNVDGEAFIKAGQVSADGTKLTAATAYVYDRAGTFEQRIDAPTGKLWPGVWQFDHARVMAPGEESFAASTYLLAASVSPDDIIQGTIVPDSVPFWDLPSLRGAAEAAGLDGTGYQLQFHSLLARPLLFIAMVLIAAAFSLRFFRFGGIEKMISGGVGAGFVLYVATKFVGDLGGVGLLSPFVAGWTPAVVANLLGAFALLNQEDG
ncbi:MAG: Lipopolysaccharide export system permease protein LptG [Beijerinckiaceae bacterium]|jgi:lipopolysaccharide export system permease protein|nr:MAG: Lipopolysaccharide export system permease protein LptG [Beijerinckiaceae bacterium]